MRYVCSVFIALSALISPLSADDTGLITGEVRCEQCNNFTGMYVVLSGDSGGSMQGLLQADVDIDGRFEVREIPCGNYTLSLLNERGTELKRSLVIVNGSYTTVSMNLNILKSQKPGTGTVSVTRLKHKPVKSAVKAFSKAVEKTKKGHAEEAIALLEKAVELDPEYMEAHNNLAVRYMVSDQVERAIPHLRKAIELDPGSASVYANLSLALGNVGDLTGAEEAARRALSIDPSARRARYLLGMSLFLQHKLNQETVTMLRQSQEMSPRAQVALAYAEAATGETAQARRTVENYLGTSDKVMRPQAEALLSRLETPPPKD
jgi:Flp pilus assembly protein TadD